MWGKHYAATLFTPSYFTKDDIVHHFFLNKSFAINLRGKYVR